MEKGYLDLSLPEFIYRITDIIGMTAGETLETYITPHEIYKYLHKETNGFERGLTITTYYSIAEFWGGRIKVMQNESMDLYKHFEWDIPCTADGDVDYITMVRKTHAWPLLWMDWALTCLERNMDTTPNEESDTSISQIIKGINDDALRTLFDALIDNDFISAESDKGTFVWSLGGSNKPQSLKPTIWVQKNECAYFVDRFNFEFMDRGTDSGKRITWKPFEALFSMETLRSAKNDYCKSGSAPERSKMLDDIINQLKVKQ